MRLRSRRIAALSGVTPVLATVLLGACFDFNSTIAGGPLDGAAADTAPAVILDAGTDVAPRDATSPLDANDATVPVDAGSDAGTSADAEDSAPPPVDSGHSFCAAFAHSAAKIYFCNDFDEPFTLPGNWNSIGEMGGTITETDASALSSPNSLDETTQPLALGTTMNVAVRATLAAPSYPSTLRFAFAVEPLQIDPTANAAIVLGAVDFLDTPGNRYTLGVAINVASGAPALALGEQSGFVDGGAPFSNHQLPPTEPLTMNAWSNVVLQINWTSATSAEALVSVNGTTELDVSLTVTVQPSALQIGVGTSYVTEPSPVWELRYDNVVFTAQ